MKQPYWLLACFMLTLSLLGCEPEPRRSSDSSGDHTEDFDEEFDWKFYDEPFGDESSLTWFFDPDEPSSGNEVAVTVRSGSIYGPLPAVIWIRVGSADSAVSYSNPLPNGVTDPAEAGWVLMTDEGLFQEHYDDQGNELAPKPVGQEAFQEEHPGFSQHTANVSLPPGGTPTIEVVIEYESIDRNFNPIMVKRGFVLWPKEVEMTE
ncbi:MAG: hypothetical protein AAGD32_08085 [Planctomycetota bacterium]